MQGHEVSPAAGPRLTPVAERALLAAAVVLMLGGAVFRREQRPARGGLARKGCPQEVQRASELDTLHAAGSYLTVKWANMVDSWLGQ